MRAVRVVRGKRGCLCVLVRAVGSTNSGDRGFVHQTARPRRFSARRVLQWVAEGTGALRSKRCGYWLQLRRGCVRFLDVMSLLIQPLRSGPLPSQMNGPTPRNRPPTRRTACRRRFVRLGTNRPSLASGSQARRRTVGPARMTLQRSPQPSRAKGRVSATLERRMQTTKLGSLTSMVSTQQTRR